MSTRLRVTLALLALSACGGADSPAAPIVAGEPAPATTWTPTSVPVSAPASAATTAGECPWLNADLATGLLGADVTVTGTPATGSCYITSDPLTISGQITVIPNHTVDAIQTGQTTVEPIEGLGEQASWASTSTWEGRDLAGQVAVEQGGKGVTVILSAQAAAEIDDLKGKSIALARAVVAGL